MLVPLAERSEGQASQRLDYSDQTQKQDGKNLPLDLEGCFRLAELDLNFHQTPPGRFQTGGCPEAPRSGNSLGPRLSKSHFRNRPRKNRAHFSFRFGLHR